jgi:F-type H+-transporting ATPase subunit gamma
MANLKEIRVRIGSIESTKQITSAMKLVSASKLRKAQDKIENMRPYANKLQEILEDMSSGSEIAKENVFMQEREVKRALIIVLASNRGLCGGFNANANKAAIALLENEYAELVKTNDVDIITIGKKSTEQFSKKSEMHIGSYDEMWDDLRYENIADLGQNILDDFSAGKYDEVKIVYNHFKNAVTQITMTEQFLPVKAEVERESTKQNDYIMEPSKEVIVTELIPKSLKTQLFKAMLDSLAGEHGARMSAMHQATDNASEMLKDLKLQYNKARQTAITNELIEIVSGANAL